MPVFAIVFGLGIMELIVLAVLGGGSIAATIVLMFVIKGRKPRLDPDAGLAEDLSEYPPPPAPGTHRLLFEGQPARIRLVVLAAAGRNTAINADMAEGLIQAVVHGLGEVADLDRPRVRIWLGQLSVEGFAPKFFDSVKRPEPTGRPSRWILVAGPAKAGQKTICVGLALETVESSSRGNVRMNLESWNDKCRVQVVG